MYTNPIEAFAINILKGTNVLPENTIFPEVDPCLLCVEVESADNPSSVIRIRLDLCSMDIRKDG